MCIADKFGPRIVQPIFPEIPLQNRVDAMYRKIHLKNFSQPLEVVLFLKNLEIPGLSVPFEVSFLFLCGPSFFPHDNQVKMAKLFKCIDQAAGFLLTGSMVSRTGQKRSRYMTG